jgi:WW domain-binding protein 11
MPPPPGPPPGFELVIPELPSKVDAIDAAKTDIDGEDKRSPPPTPPDASDDDEPLPPLPIPAGEHDDSDSEPLPPPPVPPPETSDGDQVEVAPPRVTETTTVVHRAPIGSMPRVAQVQRRPPPPPKHGAAGFFSTAPRVVRKPPPDPATFTKSAAPTATPIVRAEHNVKLKALVPASVRVKRQEAPAAKRARVATGRAINAAPNVAAPTAGSGKAEDDTYLSFLDEMSELGAFAE